jgi:FimV-like protein
MPSLRLLSTSVLAASALMGLAPPALAADAVESAASAPIATGDTLLPTTVLRDNLWTLAGRVQHDPGITRQQVMVAMLRRNPNAFLQGNMHRLRRDVALVVPTAREIAAESPGAAEAVVAAHLQALETGGTVEPLGPTAGTPAVAAKPPAKGASAATSAMAASAATPASAARATTRPPAVAAQAASPVEKPGAKPASAAPATAVPATPASAVQGAAPASAAGEAPARAASSAAVQPATGSVIQVPAEVPAVVTPALPAASAPAAASASAAAQPAAVEEGAGPGMDPRGWAALAALGLLGVAGMAWMRRRPGAATAATAEPSSFFDENGVRRQSRPKLIDVSQAGVETARTVETLQAAAHMVRGAEVGPMPALSPDDPYREATIKLEIARTSLELGRIEAAKVMLQAVRSEGSAAQQILAGDLLHSLSPT